MSTVRRRIGSWLALATMATACETSSPAVVTPSIESEPRAAVPDWPHPELDYAYFRRAWNDAGRRWLEDNAGVKRSAATLGWRLDPTWPHRDQTAMKAYALPYAAIAGTHAALACGDRELRRELAGFFTTYLRRFSQLDALRAEGGYDKSVLDDDAAGTTRVLRWVDRVEARERLRECEVCSAQFMYGPALLIRAVASDPEPDAIESAFVREYVPLIVREHLLRPDNDVFEPSLLATAYDRLTGAPIRFNDRELLMLATTIEILHAASLRPELIDVDPAERRALQDAAADSLRRFRSWARASEVDDVTAVSFFDGMYADQAEYAYAGYDGEAFPGDGDEAPVSEIGWDSGHYHRAALAIWSAWEGRTVLGDEAPTRAEVSAIGNQFSHVIWNGDATLPNFANFSTGHDGWFRVGRGRPEFGYPPSRHCDARDDDRPCNLRMSTLGWGLLHREHPDIDRIYESLAGLALTEDPARVEHRRRVATYLDEELTVRDAAGTETHPTLLLFWLGLVADRLPGC